MLASIHSSVFFFLSFCLGSFSNTSRVGLIYLIFYWLYLDLPCWLFFFSFLNLGSFYYTSRAGFYVWGVSLTHPMLALYLSAEFLIHIPFWLHFYLGSFSYTSHVCFNFLWGISYTSHVGFLKFLFWGVSLTHPVLASFLCGEFRWLIPYWLYFYLGSFSYTSHACFIFRGGGGMGRWGGGGGGLLYWGVSLTHPMLAFFFFFFFFFLIYGFSLTDPALASFLRGEFLLHIPYWLYFFYLGSFSYTSHVCFIFLWGVSLTHPMLISFFYCGEFLLHIPYWLCFYLGSFSYTSHVCFIFL